ncbi:MAG: polysaccharide deacetylase family protein [Nitrospira sp.]|nr:polysaccharide deacetylase family protein [Nitrospira sp.]
MGTFQALSRAKSLARRCAAELYAKSPGFLRRLQGKVSILMYHRVVTAAELASQFIQPGMYVTGETFERQVRFLLKHFDVLSMPELLAMWREKTWKADHRYCVITFDDGWRDNYVHAFPVLQRYDIPATIFLPTGVIGTTKWFWPEELGWINRRFASLPMEQKVPILASLRGSDSWLNDIGCNLEAGRSDELIERCKVISQDRVGELVSRLADAMEVPLPGERLVMNWDEVRDMAAAKIAFGSHSVNHKILTTVSDAELQEEVFGSLDTLRNHGLNGEFVFCYPNGNYSPAVIRSVESAGYCAATSTEPGWEGREPAHLFRLKRIAVHDDLTCSDALFAFHLAGYNSRL